MHKCFKFIEDSLSVSEDCKKDNAICNAIMLCIYPLIFLSPAFSQNADRSPCGAAENKYVRLRTIRTVREHGKRHGSKAE